MISNNKTKKNECLKALKILNRTLKTSEKDSFGNIPNIKNDKEFQVSYEIHLTNESNLKNEKQKISQKIHHVAQTIYNFKMETNSMKPSPNAVEILKSLMENVESALNDLKEENRMKYDELASDERVLTNEIENYEKKIQDWSSMNNLGKENIPKQGIYKDKHEENSELLKECVDFDKFLANNGGYNGGWDDIDHNLFLKIRFKYKNYGQNYFDELERLIATKNNEHIIQHEEWYKSLLDLKEIKRVAIKNWRDNKKNNKNETVSLAEVELKLNQEIEKELRDRVKKREEQEKFAKRKKLNEWKLEREIQKSKELEKEKMKEKVMLEKEFEEKMKQAEVKEKLEEYKRQKNELNEYIEMEQFIHEETQKEIRRRMSNTDFKSLHQRDLANVKEKMEKMKSKEREREEKERRLERQKEKIHVESDPSRLYQPTSTWKNRVNTPRSERSGPISTPRMQHLATPTWRKGV